MNQVRLAEESLPTAEAETAPSLFPASIKERVKIYWQSLGVSNPSLIETLAEDCLNRAQRRVGRGSEEELLRRALEEAQRRFDHALARALRLPPSKETHPVAAARTAFLLSADRSAADSLFQPGVSAPDLSTQLRKILPRATPPEAHLSMPEAPLRFRLFKSPPG